jgi:excisionase family DNA binding protein
MAPNKTSNEPGQAEQQLLLHAKQAAALLGISTRTLWALTKRGEISCRRVGRRVLYHRRIVEKFAEGVLP